MFSTSLRTPPSSPPTWPKVPFTFGRMILWIAFTFYVLRAHTYVPLALRFLSGSFAGAWFALSRRGVSYCVLALNFDTRDSRECYTLIASYTHPTSTKNATITKLITNTQDQRRRIPHLCIGQMSTRCQCCSSQAASLRSRALQGGCLLE